MKKKEPIIKPENKTEVCLKEILAALAKHGCELGVNCGWFVKGKEGAIS